MAISCPNCGTEANVNGDVRRAGRLVRCRQCGTAWFARSVQDDPYARADLRAADVEGISDAVVIDEPTPNFIRPRAADAILEPSLMAKVSQNLPVRLATIAAIAAVGFVMLRAPLVAAFPQLNTAMGVAGVEFRGIKSETVRGGAGRTLIVEGQIVNTLATTVDLPLVKVAVKGGDGTEVSAWVVQPAQRLTAGQAITFRSARAAPAQAASEVTVSFAK